MPELPEVETTRLGISPYLLQQSITDIRVHNKNLRWPVPQDLISRFRNQSINAVERRGKYLLINTAVGTLIIHLGMSGSLRIVEPNTPLRKHDHVEWLLDNNKIMRFHDPRRFGCVLWAENAAEHSLIKVLGPEPFADEFNGAYLHATSRKRSVAIKNLIMNSHIVTGVGNIYASEALFMAGIRPKRMAQRISKADSEALACAIKIILKAAIEQGGTTLRDFVREDGTPGYFKQQLFVYGREGQACRKCQHIIKQYVLGQRSTYYCSNCQK
ncbi:MAG: bifunctional DNA-formamidopyrimidine glycosylase/DNA-(apurinic or apyrimidinic site) lyase [Gammaproteobacteria bacterium]|nr:bifunctional DNA-formamidopyrimidine glycosylase/DNA-(apurinic or apyrimidinic site) lyase [Gammaproteobacteria bacterium]